MFKMKLIPSERPVEYFYGGLCRPLPGVANVKSSVANNKTAFKDLTLKHLL
jgi:hypothetical protein